MLPGTSGFLARLNAGTGNIAQLKLACA